jgi:hypothetical protein
MARGYQFDYPEKSWSEGKMRKRGDQYAKMDRLQRGLPGEGGQLAEIDRAAGMGIAARGGPTGTMQVPAAVVPTQKLAADAVAQHKDFIKENMNEVAMGNMTPEIFKRMLKQFGWEGDLESATFKDPNGAVHRIEAEAK